MDGSLSRSNDRLDEQRSHSSDGRGRLNEQGDQGQQRGHSLDEVRRDGRRFSRESSPVSGLESQGLQENSEASIGRILQSFEDMWKKIGFVSDGEARKKCEEWIRDNTDENSIERENCMKCMNKYLQGRIIQREDDLYNMLDGFGSVYNEENRKKCEEWLKDNTKENSEEYSEGKDRIKYHFREEIVDDIRKNIEAKQYDEAYNKVRVYGEWIRDNTDKNTDKNTEERLEELKSLKKYVDDIKRSESFDDMISDIGNKKENEARKDCEKWIEDNTDENSLERKKYEKKVKKYFKNKLDKAIDKLVNEYRGLEQNDTPTMRYIDKLMDIDVASNTNVARSYINGIGMFIDDLKNNVMDGLKRHREIRRCIGVLRDMVEHDTDRGDEVHALISRFLEETGFAGE